MALPERQLSVNRVSFFRTEWLKDGWRLVVYPTYDDEVFGYCVGWEGEETQGEKLFWVYMPICFIPRNPNQTAAQDAVDWAIRYKNEQTHKNDG